MIKSIFFFFQKLKITNIYLHLCIVDADWYLGGFVSAFTY
jgi:hypothetical protein